MQVRARSRCIVPALETLHSQQEDPDGGCVLSSPLRGEGAASSFLEWSVPL
jgi:hypothetical protein